MIQKISHISSKFTKLEKVKIKPKKFSHKKNKKKFNHVKDIFIH